MRSIVFAALIAAGFGLAGTANVSAAPISGAGISGVVNSDSNVTQVQHWRWGSRGYRRGGHWRWGSRGYRRCHIRGYSGSRRC